MLKIFGTLILTFCAIRAGVAMEISSDIQTLDAGSQVIYSFQVLDEGMSVTDKNLVETHTQILHLIAYDASLNEFNHVHPVFDGSLWTAELVLPVNGNYKVWAQGETITGEEFSVSTDVKVENGQPELPVQPLGDVRTGVDGTTQVDLDSTVIKANKTVMVDFTISRTDGTTPQHSDYLGAFAHVIATPLNGNELIHVHPMAGNEPNKGMLHAKFPTAGEYRLWIQFNDNNVLKTIPLSVVVQ